MGHWLLGIVNFLIANQNCNMSLNILNISEALVHNYTDTDESVTQVAKKESYWVIPLSLFTVLSVLLVSLVVSGLIFLKTIRSNSRFYRVKNSTISRTHTHRQTDRQSDFLGFLSKPKRGVQRPVWHLSHFFEDFPNVMKTFWKI